MPLEVDVCTLLAWPVAAALSGMKAGLSGLLRPVHKSGATSAKPRLFRTLTVVCDKTNSMHWAQSGGMYKARIRVCKT